MQFEQQWKEVFLAKDEGGDPYSEFASKIGKTRGEAKEIHWRNVWLWTAEMPIVVKQVCEMYKELHQAA